MCTNWTKKKYLIVCNENGNETELGLKLKTNSKVFVKMIWTIGFRNLKKLVQTWSSIKEKIIKLKLDQSFLLKSRIKQY